MGDNDVNRPAGRLWYEKVLDEANLDKVLNDIASGMSLRSACKSMGVTAVSFLLHVRKDKNLEARYIEAKEMCADILASEILDIADDGSNDYMEVLDKQGNLKGYRENGEFVNRSKLRIESRKWLAAVTKPTVYGNKQQVDLNATVNVEETLSEGRKRAMEREKPES